MSQLVLSPENVIQASFGVFVAKNENFFKVGKIRKVYEETEYFEKIMLSYFREVFLPKREKGKLAGGS